MRKGTGIGTWYCLRKGMVCQKDKGLSGTREEKGNFLKQSKAKKK